MFLLANMGWSLVETYRHNMTSLRNWFQFLLHLGLFEQLAHIALIVLDVEVQLPVLHVAASGGHALQAAVLVDIAAAVVAPVGSVGVAALVPVLKEGFYTFATDKKQKLTTLLLHSLFFQSTNFS